MYNMSYHFGKTGYLVLQKQAAEGTADAFVGGSTAGEIGMPITEQPGVKPVIEKEFKNYYKKSSAEYSDYTVKRLAAEGDVAVPGFPGGPLELLTFGTFGSVSSALHGTETLVYDNTFVMAQDLPIWTMAVGRDALAYQEFYDVRFGSMDVKMAAGEDITVTSTATGKGGNISKSAFTPAYGTERSFAFDDLGVSIGGSANCDVTDFELKIDRGIKSVRTACAAAAKGDNMIYTSTIDVSGSMELFFQDYTEYKYWLGGASAVEPTFNQSVATTGRDIVITATGNSIGTSANNVLTITIPKAVYDTSEIDMPFDDRMKIKFDFKALHDPTTETGAAGTGTIKAEIRSLFDAAAVLV
jgi:hypothetical protein